MRHLLLFLLLPLHMFAAEPDATPEAAKPPPAPHGPGATYAPEGTAFQLFSPTAKSVSVVLYDAATGDAGRTATPLKQSSDGLWNAAVTGDLKGKFYTYALTGPGLDAKREVMDPYAVNAVASSTRARIAPMSAPVRPGPKLESPTDMVIYEMSVRDFTMSPNSGVQNRGLYPGFAEAGTRLPDQPRIRTGLDHLSELGVTHVQLMPVLDFENDEVLRPYNWGYISTGFFSPEGSYATNPMDDSRVRELKALINALHARGIGVILDVVYNHTAESASLLFISNDYYFRHLPDGSLANGSACGNEIRSEAPMTRKLIIDSLKFWVTEYGVDGFRFDLMALIDQDTMLEADRELRAIRPDIVLYGEPWKAGPTPLAKMSDKDGLRDISPVGAFDDDFRNALKGFPDGNEPGWIQNGSNREALKKAMQLPDWFGSPEQSINYMTCHDNLVLWDKLQASMPGASGPLLKETMKLGYLALLTSQGVPFIHGGEEFARSKGGDFNSYVSSDSVNALDWSLKLKNFGLFNYVRAAIAMRKAHPVFRLRTRSEMLWRLKFEDTPGDRTIMFTLDSSGIPNESWKKVCVVLNSADTENASVTLPEGKWQVALDEHGVAGPLVSGNVNVRWKSGLVLYQN